jgi:hypothetical protein
MLNPLLELNFEVFGKPYDYLMKAAPNGNLKSVRPAVPTRIACQKIICHETPLRGVYLFESRDFSETITDITKRGALIK